MKKIWLENTFDKLGHEIEIKAIGYKRTGSASYGSKNSFEFTFEVTNSGLSDQVHDDILVITNNM